MTLEVQVAEAALAVRPQLRVRRIIVLTFPFMKYLALPSRGNLGQLSADVASV